MLKKIRSLRHASAHKSHERRRPEPAKPRIPVTLVTGFLGSGKTTLINAVLREPAFAGTLVIVNEFGEIGLDNDLIADAQDGVVLLESGCLCCAASGTLRDTLIDLFAQRRSGVLSQVQHIIVETSGLANPGPLIATLIGDSALVPRVSLAQVLTLVDAVNADTTLDTYAEARHQVAFADTLVLTKWAQASEDQTDTLMEQLAALNHDATVVQWSPDEPALQIFQAPATSSETPQGGGAATTAAREPASAHQPAQALTADNKQTDVWIGRLMRSGGAQAATASAPRLFDQSAGPESGAAGRVASDGTARKDATAKGTAGLRAMAHSSAFADVTTCTLRFPRQPLSWETYASMIAALTSRYGRRLLRCKGLLLLGGQSQIPAAQAIQATQEAQATQGQLHVIQGVQGYFAPPQRFVAQEGRQPAVTAPFLVFILDDIPPAGLRTLLASLPGLPELTESNPPSHSQETDS